MDAHFESRKDFPFNVLLTVTISLLGIEWQRMNDYWSKQDVLSYSNWFGELKDVQWTNCNVSFKPEAENCLQQRVKILNKKITISDYLRFNT